MRNLKFLGAAVAAIGVSYAALAYAAPVPTTGPAAGGEPAWHISQGVNAGGNLVVGPGGKVTVVPRQGPPPGAAPANAPPRIGNNFGCARSTICTRTGGPSRDKTDHVIWDGAAMGYTINYPIPVPEGPGGLPGAAVDSKGNLWVLQRAPKGSPQLFKFDASHKLVLKIGADVIGFQQKGHALAVDPFDNVWLSDTTGGTVHKVGPDGKLLLTLGVDNKPGDWVEEKNQRLLWQPVAISFAKNGDAYIGMGHANESPNDVDTDNPENVIGAARVLVVDNNGKYKNQWYGDDAGPGKFDSTHGMAVDPSNGDVYIGDREQYRIVVYSAEGKFIRTIGMRNLTCGLAFDRTGQFWVSSGMDGQILKVNKVTGKVLGALGSGQGIEAGKFNEANYFSFDNAGNVYVGDTGIGRITVFSPPKKK